MGAKWPIPIHEILKFIHFAIVIISFLGDIHIPKRINCLNYIIEKKMDLLTSAEQSIPTEVFQKT